MTLKVGVILSLTGQFARFGVQAAQALRLWAELDGDVTLEVIDDAGSREQAANAVRQLHHCDLLLGPYSTVLANATAKAATDDDRLLWNHGGSGVHVETGFPGHVISVLTPTSRYAEPFVEWFSHATIKSELVVAEGKGLFARQVARGAADACKRLGIQYRRARSADLVGAPTKLERWSLFSAGSFEEEVGVANWALSQDHAPQFVGAVGAAVGEFKDKVARHDGVLGVGQWVASHAMQTDIGPTERDFLAAYRSRWPQPVDYPGIQAVAGGVIAVHCARAAKSTGRIELWEIASSLSTVTLFGSFGVDPVTGEQTAHRMALVRWEDGRLKPVSPG